MSAATDRLLTKYNGRIYNPDSNAGGLDGPGGMEANYLAVAADVATVGGEVAGNAQDVSGLRDAVAADRLAVGNDRAAVATDRAATQALVGQAQAARDGAAADRVLAQQYVGTATNVLIPAINYRLASAWDGNGNATAYSLTNVVATGVYDTSKDPDGGRWCKGRLARMTSWYNETLNTATRGAKRRFPAIAPWALTTTQLIIYDQNDLDANGSPRMWMVINKTGVLNTGQNYQCAFALAGRVFIGAGPAAGGLFGIDFPADQLSRRHIDSSLSGVFVAKIAERNTANLTFAYKFSAYLVDAVVNSVHARVLPGAPLDPVSRLPIPTIAIASAGGVSVIHPTGLVANVSGGGLAPSKIALSDNQIYVTQGGSSRVCSIPYSAQGLAFAPIVYSDIGGLRTLPGAMTALARWLGGIAYGGAAGVSLVAEDIASPTNGMVSYVTKDYATGWMPGDTRLAAICEGAGSNGASGGNLFTAGSGGTMDNTTGFATVNASLASTGGELVVTSVASGSAVADSTYAVTAGIPLTVEFTYRRGTSGGNVLVQVTDGTSGAAVLAMAQSTSTSNVTDQLTITPSGVQITVRLFHSATAAGQTAFFDTVSVRKTGMFSDAVTGSGELIVNGDGSTTAGWQAYNGGTLSTVGGRLRATYGTAIDFGYQQAFPTVVGETYLIVLTVNKQTAPGVLAFVDTANGGTYVDTTTAGDQLVRFQFKATSTSTKFILRSSGGGQAAGQYVEAFGISCKLCIPDRSYKGKGLIPVGTLTRAPVAAGSDLYLLSGFNANSYVEQPYNPDYDYGTGDLFYKLLLRVPTDSLFVMERAYYTGGAYSGPYIAITKYNSTAPANVIRVTVFDGTTAQTIDSSIALPGSAPCLVWFIRRNGRFEIWINGEKVADVAATAAGSLANTNAVLRIGARQNGVGSNTNAEAGLVGTGAYAPTPAQIKRAYTDEIAAIGGKMFLGGMSNNVQSLALDEDTGVLTVGTGDGIDRFAGLRRMTHVAPAAGSAFTASSVTSVAAGGGTLLVGTANEAGVVSDLMPIKDELRQVPAAANGNDVVLTGVTTDATPLDLGKIFVGEAESVQIEADIQATEYGQTPTDGASYTVRARARRNLGGNVQLVGSAYHVTVDETTATMDATITVDTTAQAFAINVTGVASKRLIWRAVLRLNWISETRNAA